MLQKLLKRPALLTAHIALLLVVAGAVVTSLSARKGMLHLRVGETSSSYVDDADGMLPLPFSLRLDEFSIVCYPGTDTPSDYRSGVTVLSGGAVIRDAEISMNHIFTCKGYRFYQSSYDSDEQGSTFIVSHDPVGIGIVYTGYSLFLLAFFIFFFTDRKFRGIVRKVTSVAAVALFLVFGGAYPASAAEKSTPKVLPKDVAERFGELYVSYHGRVCPLQTVAGDFRTKLYGNRSLDGLSDEQVLTGWMFYPSSWYRIPQKSRRGANDAGDRAQTVNALLSGEFLKIYPLADSSGKVEWYSQNDALPEDIPDDEWLFIRKGMNYIGELVVSQDYETLLPALDKIRKFQRKQAGDSLPSDFRFKSERLYNSFPPLFACAGLYLLLGLALLGWYVRCIARDRTPDIRVHLAAVVMGAVLLLFLTLMLALMWIAGGHIPLSNGAETMMAIAWTVLAAGLGTAAAGNAGERKSPALMQPFSLIVASLALLVAAMGQSNPAVTLLVPVLSSPLLSIHVSLMMLSYAILSVITVNSAAGLCINAFKGSGRTVARLADMSVFILYFGVFFLAAGIVTGSVWANISWGCYWNWDPKETWALITMLIYAVVLHRHGIPPLRKPVVCHIYLLLAFISVLFTYFGVNFFLGGMHSYA